MILASRFLILAVVWLAALLTLAAELPRAKPEEVGLSSAQLDNIRKVLGAKVDAGEIPGYVALVARRGKVATATPPTCWATCCGTQPRSSRSRCRRL